MSSKKLNDSQLSRLMRSLGANLEITFLDIETTGFNKINDRIIEIAAIKIKNGEIIKKYQTYVRNIDNSIPRFITELTGIYQSDVENGTDLEIALKKLKQLIGDSMICAHNGFSFDFLFLNEKYRSSGIPMLENYMFDTYQIANSYFANQYIENKKLITVAKFFKIEINEEELHGALYDVEVLIQIWKHFEKWLLSKN